MLTNDILIFPMFCPFQRICTDRIEFGVLIDFVFSFKKRLRRSLGVERFNLRNRKILWILVFASEVNLIRIEKLQPLGLSSHFQLGMLGKVS